MERRELYCIIKFAVQTEYERMRGPDLAGLKTLKTIQAAMFKITGDVSYCTDKCMQVLEALYFLRDMVQTFCALIQLKFECQIQYCFKFSALNLTVKTSNETRFSIMELIYSPLEGMWLVQWNVDLMSLYMTKSSI